MSDPISAIALIYKLTSVAVLVGSLELLFLVGKGEFSVGGAWDWQVIAASTSPRSSMVDFVFRANNAILYVLLARISCACAALYLPWEMPGSGSLVITLTLIQLALNMRLIWGDDGSDQMLSIVLAALVIAAIFHGHSPVEYLCLLFIATQLTLSYFCSGVAKLFGSKWRDGTALLRVVGHYAYGNRGLHRFLSSRLHLAKIANHSVIAFQLLFPLYWVIDAPWAFGCLAAGLMFHLSIAVIMRLNGFLFSFGAGYPALIYIHEAVPPPLW